MGVFMNILRVTKNMEYKENTRLFIGRSSRRH